MKKPTDMGTNRTGIDASPIDSKRTIEGAAQTKLVDPGDMTMMAHERITWAEDADPLGTMPPPASLKGVAKTVVEKVKGNQPNVFLDKLGERLAFERTGVRLYEALLCKLPAANPHEGAPTRDEVELIRDDELHHFAMLKEALASLGADPTAMTPGADVVATASSGLLAVLTDPRSTLSQCLEVMLIAELADNDSWAMLINLAEGLQKSELADRFRAAYADEEDHLRRLRNWITIGVSGQAGISPTPPRPHAPH